MSPTPEGAPVTYNSLAPFLWRSYDPRKEPKGLLTGRLHLQRFKVVIPAPEGGDVGRNGFEVHALRGEDDDVLTLMIHLGYLVYDPETSMARIPNEELRIEFNRLIKRPANKRLSELVRNSEKLLKDTLSGNEEAVASAIVRVRDTNYAPMFYNNEQALRYVIKFAYIICVDYYLKVEELPTGHGIADVVFIPKRDTSLPAMIVELKWNKTAEGAIKQIKENHYPELLSDYVGEMMLVGINYNEETKEHSCKIEKIRI